jgi:hypothetical protein
MSGVFARRISLSVFLFVLFISILGSAMLGSYAVTRERFAHMSDEIYGFTGARVEQLTNAELRKLGNPARVDCSEIGCIRGIETDGDILCVATASRIFGAGPCIKTSRVIEDKKGSTIEYGYYCEAKVPESEAGCKTQTYWGNLNSALASAIKEAQKCCPGGTKVKKHNEGYYCEEG